MRNPGLTKIVAGMSRLTLAAMMVGFAISSASTGKSSIGRNDTTAKTQQLKVIIKEWAVPTKGGHPHDPAVGADGALWFTEQMANKIGRLDPKTGNIKEYPLKVTNSGPHGLVSDRDGSIWFTANFAGYIGKLDPKTGEVKEFKMPVEKADDPHSLIFDSNGTLWFTLQGANMVGRLDPTTGKVELKDVPTENALPYGIQMSSKGVPFFCELGSHKIGSIDRKTMAMRIEQT